MINPKLKNILHYWQFIWQRVNEDRCGQMASALTLTTLLTLVPLLTVVFTVLGVIPTFRAEAQQLMNTLFLHFLPTSVEAIQGYLQQFTVSATEFTVVGGVLLFFSAIIIFANIEQSLNTIWRTPIKRKGLGAVALYWAILTLTPLVIVGSIALTSYFSVLQPLLFAEVTRGAWIKTLPFLSSVVVFTLLYIFVPNAKVPFTHAAVGGLVAAVLFAVGRWAFRLYVAYFPNYQLLYGALAILPIFAIWIYLSWVFILIGAEITHGMRYYYRKNLETLPYFLIVYRWLGLLWEGQHKGIPITLVKLLNKQPIASRREGELIIENLVEHRWLRKTAEGDYVLARDLHEVSLIDLHRSLNYPLPTIKELQENMHTQENTFIGDAMLLDSVERLEKSFANVIMPSLAECYNASIKQN